MSNMMLNKRGILIKLQVSHHLNYASIDLVFVFNITTLRFFLQ